ncbi:MAG: TIGR01212 family radical SAM protein [Clostridia bacterium]|nr:TIGR01212 family radical SAM protein [Clostridia bacterium]
MEKHYYSLNDYLQKTFGEKVYKLSLDLGLTCPNRDGTLDTRGCIFCLAGSSHFSATEGSIAEKLERARSLVAKKTKAERFIAYFQSYTNTYAPTEYLDRVFNETADREEIVALSVATRPDCLSDEVVALLADINKRKPVWVELGLQTSNEKTAEYIRRCYKNEVYTDAVARLKAAGLQVITHVIIGLPNETEQDVYKTLDFAVSAGTDGVKLQLLHILRGTDLYDDYIERGFEVLTLEGYMDILFECIELIPEHIVIHRITGDAPKAHLVAPLWSADKRNVLNTINRELARRGIRQGSKAKKQ